MRWQRGHRSPDIIDRRGAGVGLPIGAVSTAVGLIGRRFGIVGVLVALAVLGLGYFLMSGGQSSRLGAAGETRERATDERVEFVGFVLDDAQAVWQRQFAERNASYPKAKLVLFTDQTTSGCGFGSAATGPFYCPTDSRVYLDLGFFRELEKRLGAPGDFAQAYVIAHEIGHHVQNVLGINQRVQRAPAREQAGAQGLSVKVELQADCFAGIWASSTQRRELLEQGDLEEALGAAAAIGDDRLQRQSSGTVQPEKWTHGSSAQRSRWFRRGLEQGRLEECDTFAAAQL